MKSRLFYISFLLAFLPTVNVSFSQTTKSQEDYIKTPQEKNDFNNKNWSNLKETIINESKQSFDTENGNNKGSFYDYDEEGYDGEFSEYKNDDLEYSDENYKYREGDDSYGGNGGGANYYPKDNEKYGEQEYHPKDKVKRQKPSKANPPSFSGGGLGIFQYVLFGILIVFLAYLIYQLFMKSSLDEKGKKVATTYDELEPSQIPKSELELLLEDAIAKNDFRSAIRIYFVFILKDLSEKEWIRWEKKKTNFSYLIEMRGRPQYDSFNDAVSVYELVWYGNYVVNKSDFLALEPRFKNLLTSLNTASK